MSGGFSSHRPSHDELPPETGDLLPEMGGPDASAYRLRLLMKKSYHSILGKF
jgi:hypothetical protein